MSTSALVNQLKENDQDFEFYPTTKEMIETIYFDLAKKDRDSKYYSVLDIGAGNGGFFEKFKQVRQEVKEHNIAVGCSAEEDWCYKENSEEIFKLIKPKADISTKYAIEKSEILINQMAANIMLLGTDFWEQTLIDKEVDIIFSNPPYSQFEDWSAKIIREAHAAFIYLVIPQRWQESELLKDCIAARKATVKVLGDFNFLDAERAARAKVEVIKINLVADEERFYRRDNLSDPFDSWFESVFKIQAQRGEERTWREEGDELARKKQQRQAEIENELVAGRDLVQVLVALYQRDLNELMKTYQVLGTIDEKLMKELGVKLEEVKKNLKMKIKGLKNFYWAEIFSKLDKIKERLCSSQRQTLLGKLDRSIDFTESNIYAVLIWVIKNANQYLDQQIKDLFEKLTEREGIRNYKSNQTTWEKDGWRYRDQAKSHYCIDYRIVTRGYWEGFSDKRLSQNTIDLIDDIITVANNLGFDGQTSKSFGWDTKPSYGEKQEFYMRPNWQNNNTAKNSLFMEARFYKNGNAHLKINQDFMKAFNIEAARLNGWVRSAEDILREFPDDCKVNAEEIKKYYKANFLISCSSPKNLLQLGTN
ncbi:MAG: DUF4942 domain-containing protein [Proteobacteria bacterium]|nr:DUF4942 domain-containing protein [Pseudomonadota bacterium]